MPDSVRLVASAIVGGDLGLVGFGWVWEVGWWWMLDARCWMGARAPRGGDAEDGVKLACSGGG